MIDAAEYLSAADISRLLGRSERTVRRWIKSNALPSAKIGGTRLVAKTELERLLRSSFSNSADDE